MDKFEKYFKVFKENYREIPLIPVSDTPFHALVAVMLSARTRDETTAARCGELFGVASTPQKIANLPVEELEHLIKPVSFYKTKAVHLKKLAQAIVERFHGEVPHTLEELTSLPGVGRKTANIILAREFNIPAIGVDTHVHRIANFLGWVHTKTPEETEQELAKALPQKYWVDLNLYLVSIGQQYRNNKLLQKFLEENNLA
ncbi:MAG: endonuclease III [Candidatus Blackburnbacteria bacterium]|nr:endonuclease III [Candidatus Blackburnbacteria bacterium]